MAAIFQTTFSNAFSWMKMYENVWISINISLKFVPRGPINNILTLVQVMAWHRPGYKPLSELMMVRLPTHICVTRPQWVNWRESRDQRGRHDSTSILLNMDNISREYDDRVSWKADVFPRQYITVNNVLINVAPPHPLQLTHSMVNYIEKDCVCYCIAHYSLTLRYGNRTNRVSIMAALMHG